MGAKGMSKALPGRFGPTVPAVYRLPVLLLLFCSQLFVQQDITGKTWIRWGESRQVAYLAGFYAGLKTDAGVFRQAERDHRRRGSNQRDTVTSERYKSERQEYYARKVKYNFNLLRQLLDAFYKDPDNLLISTPEAIRIVMLRQEGDRERADFLLKRERRKVLQGK